MWKRFISTTSSNAPEVVQDTQRNGWKKLLASNFDVIDKFRSSSHPVVATVLARRDDLKRAAARRGYATMRSRFLNFGHEGHVPEVCDRSKVQLQRLQPRLLILIFPSRVWSQVQNFMSSLRSRERLNTSLAHELVALDFVVELCEMPETYGNLFFGENSVSAPSWI